MLFAAAAARAQLVINPTTTYTAETSNNTSASSMFTDVYFITKQNARVSNGDAVPRNVSKVDVHALYPNSNTKIYAEWQAWWCHQTSNEQNGTLNPDTSQHSCSSHIDIGYSNTQSQVTAEVNDMISRGFAGAIIDWNGPGTISDTSAGYLRTAAEATGGQFQFAIMIDKGAFGGCASNSACTSTGITRVQDVMSRYASSSAYMKTSAGNPMIFFFVDSGTNPNNTQIDWASLKANSGGNPIFLGDGKGNFSVMDGAYGWENVVLTGDRTGITYLDQFYQSATSSANASKPVVGATFKGFNDTLSSWSPAPPNGPRINYQRCGQTWLNSFSDTRKFYPPATKPLNWIQAVTWDDYEEGTEIETGIDNCVSSVTGGVTGSSLSWKTNFGPDPDDPSLTGTEATIHHYTVFISTDGQNLMVLQDNITPGLNTLDLSQYNIGPGNYTLYVKAVGQPSITNHMSGPIQYTVQGGGVCLVNMTSPANNSTVNSPVQVTATGTPAAGATITSMEIDVDGTAVYTTTAASVNQSLTMTSGSHLVTVNATDSAGHSCGQTASINVGVQGVQVSVTSPAAGATVNSPVTVTASATSTHTITGWHIYVDNVDSFSAGQVTSISASLPLSAGSHTIITRAWDSTGAYGDDTRTVTVAAAGVTVNVTSPTTTSVTSPVTIAANATSAHTITGWHIYVDSVDKYSAGQVSSISASIAMAAGSHTVIVRAWDSTGAYGDQTLSLTATEPITVTVSSPANNATLQSPVTINASATSGRTITGWHIYVDSVDSFSAGQVSSISASVPMDIGTHTVIVRAWDASGAFDDQTLTLNVVAGVNVSVSKPVPNSTVSSPVAVNASATSSRTITGWHIYVDNVDKFSAGQVSSISASISGLTAGTHTMIVRAWDASGAFGDETMQITVVTGVTVTVSTPSNNATVNSPTTIAASATSGHTITGWHIYVDGTDQFSAGQVSSINASVAMSVGTHTVIVRAWDSSGAFGDQTLTLNVVNGVAVTVSSPSNGATVSSPVTVAASATSAHTITGWHIYVDSADRYSAGQVSSISTSLTMSSGTHTIIVRAWDSTGAYGDRTLSITVP